MDDAEFKITAVDYQITEGTIPQYVDGAMLQRVSEITYLTFFAMEPASIDAVSRGEAEMAKSYSVIRLAFNPSFLDELETVIQTHKARITAAGGKLSGPLRSQGTKP